MDIELYKQQGLDLFKRFEIAVPQKKTGQALQIGIEHHLNKAFTNDGKYMLGFSNQGTATHLTIYELPSAKCLFYYIYTGFEYSNFEVLPTNQVLLNATNADKIMLIDISSGEVIKAFEGNYYGEKNIGSTMFKVEINNRPFIYLPPNGLFEIPVTEDKIKGIFLAPDKKHYVVMRKHELQVCDIETNSVVFIKNSDYIFDEVSVSLDSTYFVAFMYPANKSKSDGMLNTYLLDTGQQCQSRVCNLYQALYVPFSQGWVIFNSFTFYVFYPKTNLYKELPASAALMECFVAEFDGKAYMILYYSLDYHKYSIVAYNLNQLYNPKGEPQPIFSKIYNNIPSVQVQISPDMRTMAVYVTDQPFEFYHIGSFEHYGELPGSYYSKLEFSANSKNVIISRTPKFFVYNTQTLKLHNTPIASIKNSAYDENLKLMAVVDSDYYLHIRDLKTGAIVYKNINPDFEFSYLMLFNNKRLFYGRSDSSLKCYHIETGETIKFSTDSGFPYIENQRYLTCKTEIVDTETLQTAPKIIPIIKRPQYYDFRDYSYPEYSLCCGEGQVLVYKNNTGQLVFQLNIPVNYNNKVVLLNNKVAVLNDNKITVYSMFTDNVPHEITFDRGNGNILSLTRYNHSVFVLHLSTNVAKFLIFDCSDGIKNIGCFEKTDSTNYVQIALPEKDIQLFITQNKVYAFNMKRMELDFEFPIFNRNDVYLDGNHLIIVCEQNRIDYYNLFEDEHYKTGERIATLFTIPDGFMWTIPPDAGSPNGWFYTDNPDYIEVMQYVDKKSNYELLPKTSAEWQKYIELHNRKDMVMARLHNPEAYRHSLFDLQGKMQHMQLQQYKHTLMLNQ